MKHFWFAFLPSILYPLGTALFLMKGIKLHTWQKIGALIALFLIAIITPKDEVFIRSVQEDSHKNSESVTTNLPNVSETKLIKPIVEAFSKNKAESNKDNIDSPKEPVDPTTTPSATPTPEPTTSPTPSVPTITPIPSEFPTPSISPIPSPKITPSIPPSPSTCPPCDNTKGECPMVVVDCI